MGLTKVTYSMIEGADVNVLDFGAQDNTDSTIAFQAAVDYCSANSKTLFIPDGTYLVTRLELKTGTKIVGQSHDAIIKRKDGTVVSAAAVGAVTGSYYNGGRTPQSDDLIWSNGAGNIELYNLTVDGNRVNQGIWTDANYRKGGSGAGYSIQNISFIGFGDYNTQQPYPNNRGYFIVNNVKSINSVGNGLAISNCDHSEVTENIFDSCGKNGVYVSQVAGLNQKISNNYIRRCGMIYGGGVGVAHSNAIVTDNTIVECFEYGILLSPTSNARVVDQSVFTGNTVRGIYGKVLAATSAVNSWVSSSYGIGIGVVQQYDVQQEQNKQVSISGNSVSGTSGSGIALVGMVNATYRMNNFTVSGNTIAKLQGAGIDARFVDNASIVGNSVHAPGTFGIYLVDVGGASVISNNSMNMNYAYSDRVIVNGTKYEATAFTIGTDSADIGLNIPPNGSYWSVVSTVDSVDEWLEGVVYMPSGVAGTWGIYSVTYSGGTYPNGVLSGVYVNNNPVTGLSAAYHYTATQNDIFTGQVTLTAASTQTNVIDPNCTVTSSVFLSPRNSAAATLFAGASYPYIYTIGNGYFVIAYAGGGAAVGTEQVQYLIKT